MCKTDSYGNMIYPFDKNTVQCGQIAA